MESVKPMSFDVSVASSVDTGVIDVDIMVKGGDVYMFPMDYASALTLRDMLTDALNHQDAGGHANPQKPLPHDEITNRLAKILDREGIWTYGQLAGLDAHDLLDFRGFGPLCLNEVAELLIEAGFEPPVWPEHSRHYPYTPGSVRDPR